MRLRRAGKLVPIDAPREPVVEVKPAPLSSNHQNRECVQRRGSLRSLYTEQGRLFLSIETHEPPNQPRVSPVSKPSLKISPGTDVPS